MPQLPQIQTVAFSVGLTGSNENILQLRTVRYDKVFVNIGDGWSRELYSFICPVKGAYKFDVNMVVHGSAGEGNRLALRLNEVMQIGIFARSGDDFYTGSNSVILQLKQGDVVDVAGWMLGAKLWNADSFYCTFSGQLIN